MTVKLWKSIFLVTTFNKVWQIVFYNIYRTKIISKRLEGVSASSSLYPLKHDTMNIIKMVFILLAVDVYRGRRLIEIVLASMQEHRAVKRTVMTFSPPPLLFRRTTMQKGGAIR